MGKIDELIQQYCPDGVEYKTLGEVCEFRAGWGFPEVEQGLAEGKYPFYKVGDMNNSEMFMDTANNYISEETSKKLKCKPAPKGTIIFPKIGATMNTNKKRILTKQSCYDNNVMGLIAKSVNDRFLYYFFSQYKLIDFAKGTGAVPSLDTNRLKALPIPLPPLPVQEAIVNILDRFAVYAAELQAELQARQQQYNYYRDTLLSFDGREDVQWKKLGEVASIKTGAKPDLILKQETDFEYINAGTTNSGYTYLANSDGDTITTPSRGQGGIGFVGYQRNPFWLGPLCYGIISKEEQLLTKYLYYYLVCHNDIIHKLKNTGGVPALNRQDLIGIKIPIPTVNIQQHIISVLDRFDTLVNDQTQGLPAEIEARRLQYEYYRDQLLTFKRKEA